MNYMRWWRSTAAGLALCLTGTPVNAQQAGAPAGQIEEKAMSTLTRAVDFLTKAQHFSVKTDISYDVMQDSGQKLEFGATRTITVRRPDRITVDIEDRDGTKRGFRFDGKQIAFFDVDEKVYAIVEKPGDIDAAYTYFTHDLQTPLPLGDLFLNNLSQNLKDRVKEAYYVGEATIGGTRCDQLALRNDTRDVQVWISKEDQPLLRRLILTYKSANGQPQFRADFRDWNWSAETPDSLFTFSPAEGANRIQFVAQQQK